MLGNNHPYKDYFKNDEDKYDFDEDKYLRKEKIKKNIFIGGSILFLLFLIVFSVVGINTRNPYIAYDLTERNDFYADFSDPNIIKDYYPEN